MAEQLKKAKVVRDHSDGTFAQVGLIPAGQLYQGALRKQGKDTLGFPMVKGYLVRLNSTRSIWQLRATCVLDSWGDFCLVKMHDWTVQV